MKTRESGMPDEQTWDSFFDPSLILTKLGLTAACRNVIEFGCGYGTFTIPAARIISGTLYAIDIDAEMIAATKKKADTAGLHNVKVRLRDFAAEGTGLAPASADYVMLFNILHAEQPMILLEDAYRVLSLGGKVGIVHWNHDPSTPRGPSMSIRPRPEQCAAWAEQAGFQRLPSGVIGLPPYHYGMVLKKAGGDCRRQKGRSYTMEPVKAGQILCCNNCGVELKVVKDCDSTCVCNIICYDQPMRLKKDPDDDAC